MEEQKKASLKRKAEEDISKEVKSDSEGKSETKPVPVTVPVDEYLRAASFTLHASLKVTAEVLKRATYMAGSEIPASLSRFEKSVADLDLKMTKLQQTVEKQMSLMRSHVEELKQQTVLMHAFLIMISERPKK